MGNKHENELIVVGKLGAPYGIKGWVKVSTYTNSPEDIFNYSPWIDHANPERTFEVIDWRKHNKGLVCRLADVDDRDVAQALTNVEVAIRAEQLPELPEDEFYWHDLVGMQVETAKGYNLGLVDDLLETGSNDVLVVKANSNDGFGKQERLIPFIENEVILDVDQDTRLIRVEWDPSF